MSVKVSELYPELMHYTTIDGLKGIVSSGCIWATDANSLNDATEISHFFEARLGRIIEPEVRRFSYDLGQSADKLARIIANGGFEELIALETDSKRRSIRDVTLDFNRPFVTSFCGPLDERVRKNGLLSQWRGYGRDGGCALILDTAGMERALMSEESTYAYTHVQLADVYYDGINPDLQPATPDFRDYEEVVRQGIGRLLRGGAVEETPRLYEAVTSLSCLCKHWGFWEEREVRAVAVLAREGQEMKYEFPRASKPIISHQNGGAEYIELFADKSCSHRVSRIPLKGVIVGPHRDRVQRSKELRQFLLDHGYAIEVTESEIPYLGR